MEKGKLKEKAKEIVKCYSTLTPEKKKVINYTALGFGVGLVLGYLIKRR